jgi:hypothetical protein
MPKSYRRPRVFGCNWGSWGRGLRPCVCVRAFSERREGAHYGNVAVSDDLDRDFGVIAENYGRCGFRTVSKASEMHNQGTVSCGCRCRAVFCGAVRCFDRAPVRVSCGVRTESNLHATYGAPLSARA